MLIQFNVENYRSIKDRVSLDLTATKITEHSSHVVQIGKEKLLKTAVIYGANASGKSNIYKAFLFMSYYVAQSFKFGNSEGDNKFDDDKNIVIKTEPFAFDDNNRNLPSVFEVYFTIPNDSKEIQYCYGFSLLNNLVVDEWLLSKSKTSKEFKKIIDRANNIYVLQNKFQDNIYASLNDEVLIISLGAKLKVPICKLVRDWFIANEIEDSSDIIESLFRDRSLPKNFATDEKVQEHVIKIISSFDSNIKGFNIKKTGNDEEDKYTITTDHYYTSDDGISKKAVLPLEEESAGTLKFFSLYQSFMSVLQAGSVLFVDELNTKLHPLLQRLILLTFLNEETNPNKAQIIFTSHDTWLIDTELFRRDEIWFVNKDGEGKSDLYSLAEFVDEDGTKIRKDENFEKNYLYGKYGAIPKLEPMNFLKMED